MIISLGDKKQFFDLVNGDLSKLTIQEWGSGENCFVITSDGEIVNGFKLTDKKQVNTYCEINFNKSSVTKKYIPRLTFFKLKTDFSPTEPRSEEKVIIAFTESEEPVNFWKLIGFINTFKDVVDTGEFQSKFKVVNFDSYIAEFKTKSRADRMAEINQLFETADLSEVEFETVIRERRKKTLAIFKWLLDNPDCLQYRTKYSVTAPGEEAVWHHFLCAHHWLLGLNADIKFIRDIINEADVGIKNTAGTGSPKADMMGISDYTMLIELKKPSTLIFKATNSNTARAKTWSFTSDFIDGVSQCLAQRVAWERSHAAKPLMKDGKELDSRRHRTIDPKALFIVGCKSTEFPETSDLGNDFVKRDTFENFRRNNRNLEIMTYDELYERAHYIVKDAAVV